MPKVRVNDELGIFPEMDEKFTVDKRMADTNFLHGDGIFPVLKDGSRDTSNAKVVASSPASMVVGIQDGIALVDGFTIGNRSLSGSVVTTVTIPDADPTNPRIDAVVLEVPDDQQGNPISSGDFANGQFSVIEGTPAATPARPSVPNGQVLLACVTVAAGATSISDADIDNSCKDYLCDIDDLKKEFRSKFQLKKIIDNTQNIEITNLKNRVAALEALSGGGNGVESRVVPLPANDPSKWDFGGASNIEAVGNVLQLTQSITPGSNIDWVTEDFEAIGNAQAPDWDNAFFQFCDILQKDGSAPSGASDDAVVQDGTAPYWENSIFSEIEYSAQSQGGKLVDGASSNSDIRWKQTVLLSNDYPVDSPYEEKYVDMVVSLQNSLGSSMHMSLTMFQFSSDPDAFKETGLFMGVHSDVYGSGPFSTFGDHVVQDNSLDWLFADNPVDVDFHFEPSQGIATLTFSEGANSVSLSGTFASPTQAPTSDWISVRNGVFISNVAYDGNGDIQPSGPGRHWHDNFEIDVHEADVYTYDTPGTITSQPIDAPNNLVTVALIADYIDRQFIGGGVWGTILMEYSPDNGVTWYPFDDNRSFVVDLLNMNWARNIDRDDLPSIEATPTLLFRLTLTSGDGTKTPRVTGVIAANDNSPAQADNQVVKAKINELITALGDPVSALPIP